MKIQEKHARPYIDCSFDAYIQNVYMFLQKKVATYALDTDRTIDLAQECYDDGLDARRAAEIVLERFRV